MNIWNPFKGWRISHRLSESEIEEVDALESYVTALTFDEARQQAYERLRQDAAFTLEIGLPDDVLPQQMPDGLQELFRTYKSVSWMAGISRVGREDWIPFLGNREISYKESSGYYVIGEDTELPLIIQRGAETVYIFNMRGFSSAYKSIYHWILQLS